MARKRFTRQQLHELVWTRPMRDLAAEIGISDVGLKKVCVKYGKIGVYETVERRIHRLTPEEQRKTQKGTWFYAPKYDYLSSNQFSIRRSDYDTYLQDGRNLRVEDRLNEVMRILVGRAFAARENKRLEGIRAAEAAARAARQAEIQKLQATQVAVIERLHAQASAWRKAQDLRTFIAAVEDAPDLCADARRSGWLSWAHDQADAVDPLSPDPARVLQVDFEAFARLQALTKAPATGDGKGM